MASTWPGSWGVAILRHEVTITIDTITAVGAIPHTPTAFYPRKEFKHTSMCPQLPFGAKWAYMYSNCFHPEVASPRKSSWCLHTYALSAPSGCQAGACALQLLSFRNICMCVYLAWQLRRGNLRHEVIITMDAITVVGAIPHTPTAFLSEKGVQAHKHRGAELAHTHQLLFPRKEVRRHAPTRHQLPSRLMCCNCFPKAVGVHAPTQVVV